MRAGQEHFDDMRLQDILLEDGMTSSICISSCTIINQQVACWCSLTAEARELFAHAGKIQPEAAAAALHALLVEKQTAYRITLRSKNRSGRVRWTLFEMWQATVSEADLADSWPWPECCCMHDKI